MEAALDIPIQGFSGCPGPFRGNIYLPTASSSAPRPSSAPIVTFAHGFGQGGEVTDLTNRESLFKHLVAMGFVVVAHQTGGLTGFCDSSRDQLRMLSWARTSHYRSRIDFGKVVLMGYSMGARATLKNAADPAIVSANNVVAAAAVMPDCNYGCEASVVPVQFFVGELDVEPSWQTTHEVYRAVTVDKVFAFLPGQGQEPTSTEWLALITPRIGQWMQCKVFGRQRSCETAFDNFPSCQYGCHTCGCENCTSCLPCWKPSPPSFCKTDCEACQRCRSCTECHRCSSLSLP